MNQLSEQDAAYLAGLLDGEGCIYIVRTKYASGKERYKLAVSIASTHKPVLDWVQTTLGAGAIYKRKKYGPHKQGYGYQIMTLQAAELLGKLLPHIKIKRPEAELAIRFIDETRGSKGRDTLTPERQSRRAEMYEQMRALKRVSYEG